MFRISCPTGTYCKSIICSPCWTLDKNKVKKIAHALTFKIRNHYPLFPRFDRTRNKNNKTHWEICVENHWKRSHLFLFAVSEQSTFPCDSSQKVQRLKIPSTNIHKLYSAASPPLGPKCPLRSLCSSCVLHRQLEARSRGFNKHKMTCSSYPLHPLFFSRTTSSSSLL